jgi:DNA-binding XRE family transcriptional regulator
LADSPPDGKKPELEATLNDASTSAQQAASHIQATADALTKGIGGFSANVPTISATGLRLPDLRPATLRAEVLDAAMQANQGPQQKKPTQVVKVRYELLSGNWLTITFGRDGAVTQDYTSRPTKADKLAAKRCLKEALDTRQVFSPGRLPVRQATPKKGSRGGRKPGTVEIDGDAFKQLRKKKGRTQKSLANLLKISDDTLGRIERGEPVDPANSKQVIKFCMQRHWISSEDELKKK